MSRPARVAILGSTGSIGLSALDVIRALPRHLEVAGLCAHSNVRLLLEQSREFRPKAVSLFDPGACAKLKLSLNGFAKALPPGVEGLVEMASRPDVDIVLTSLVGGVGLKPLIAAVRSGKTIALANKEPMVMAGPRLMREAERHGARIIPVDSEPSAVFQCLAGRGLARGEVREALRRVILTASGGAFYKRRDDLSRVSVKQALRHPTWSMGPKITIDSATLMNKGFETIEIMGLFDLLLPQIDVLIHHQSVIHSAVEFQDGSVVAQMSPPDMRLPIQYAMTHPARLPSALKPLDLPRLGALTFAKPDFKRFECLALAFEAARAGGLKPAALSAADEVAVVEGFLAGRIRFTDIARVVEKTLSAAPKGPALPGFDDVLRADAEARRRAREIMSRLARR